MEAGRITEYPSLAIGQRHYIGDFPIQICFRHSLMNISHVWRIKISGGTGGSPSIILNCSLSLQVELWFSSLIAKHLWWRDNEDLYTVLITRNVHGAWIIDKACWTDIFFMAEAFCRMHRNYRELVKNTVSNCVILTTKYCPYCIIRVRYNT